MLGINPKGRIKRYWKLLRIFQKFKHNKQAKTFIPNVTDFKDML